MTIKPGFRVLGIAESFEPDGRYSKMAGVVMRADLVIDGVARTRVRLDSGDATGKIISMYRSMGREDINAILIAGAVVSRYNIVDPERIHKSTKKPVICITYRRSRGIAGAIRHHFRDDPKIAKAKVEEYKRLGARIRMKLPTGNSVYVRTAGTSAEAARSIVERFTLQGAIPEPTRVAKLFARSK